MVAIMFILNSELSVWKKLCDIYHIDEQMWLSQNWTER